MDSSLARIWDDAARGSGTGSPCARSVSGLGAKRDASPGGASAGESVADENARNGAGAGRLRLLDIYLRAKREGQFE